MLILLRWRLSIFWNIVNMHEYEESIAFHIFLYPQSSFIKDPARKTVGNRLAHVVLFRSWWWVSRLEIGRKCTVISEAVDKSWSDREMIKTWKKKRRGKYGFLRDTDIERLEIRWMTIESNVFAIMKRPSTGFNIVHYLTVWNKRSDIYINIMKNFFGSRELLLELKGV